MPYLSIVIPCYNEEERLPETLHDIKNYIKNRKEFIEVIVVDDGSTDRTAEVARSYQNAIPGLWVLHYGENRGKGHAVQQGMLSAQGDYALFMDADNSTKLSEIEKLLPHTTDNDVVIGSRAMPDSDIVIHQPWYRVMLGRLGNGLIQTLLVPGIRDTQCGFKLFSKHARNAVFSRQRVSGFGSDIETLSIAKRLGYNVKEVGVTWYNAPGSKVRPIRDAWRTLRELARIKYNFLTRQYHIPSPLAFTAT